MSLTNQYSIFSMKRIIFLVITIILSVECHTRDGDTCVISRTSEIGTCKRLAVCRSAISDLVNKGIQFQVCDSSSAVPLVCCRNENQNPVITPPPRTDTSYRSSHVSKTVPNGSKEDDDCAYPDHAITVKKDESPYKAWNKCIDLADYVFPCQPGMVLGSPGIRTSTCQHEATELIIGGTAAKEHEFPHMAVLGFENKEMNTIAWDCGATLISEQWVVSAAHCLHHRFIKSNVSLIRLGDIDLTIPPKPEHLFTIIEKIQHPDYIGKLVYNDILLLKMDRSVRFSQNVRPACLHVGNDVNDMNAIATGFGLQKNKTKSDLLLKVVLEKFDYAECSLKNPIGRRSPDGIRNETQICYGDHTKPKDACGGDSGGPLQIYNRGVHCTYTLIGITNVGKGCGTVNHPGIYTRVSAFVPWIESVVWPN